FELTAVRDRVLSLALSNVNRLELRAFTSVSATLVAIPQVQLPDIRTTFNGLMLQLQEFGDEIDRFTMTPEQARAGIREFVDSTIDMLNDSPLGQLRIMLVNFQQQFLRLIESLPFAALAHQAETALEKVGDSIQEIDPQAIGKPVHDFFSALRGKIDELPKDQIRTALAGGWQGWEDG